MARKSTLLRQNDFSAGVIDRDGRRRDDSKLYNAALREGLNVRPLASGGLELNRPGRNFQFFEVGRCVFVRSLTGVRYKFFFASTTLKVWTPGNTVNTSLTGCPWGGAILADLCITVADNAVLVTHPGIQPQIIQLVGGVWVRSNFAFTLDVANTRRQPYFKFEDGAVTMTPSSYTGATVLAFSANFLTANHVGLIFRYFNCEIVITSLVNGFTANGTILRRLPTTQSVDVTSTAGYSVGDVVEGDTSGATGVVATVVSSTVLRIVLETPGAPGFANSEILIGPTAQSGITAPPSAVVPAPLTIWDEPLMSWARGWPSGCTFDRDRVTFYGFPGIAARGVLWGEIGTLTGFAIGSLPSDAMFETLPAPCNVRFVEGGPDQFVFTDIGAYYIPISAASPLQPGAVEFRAIDSTGIASNVRPVVTLDGSVYLNEERTRVMSLRATGQTARPYLVEDISEYHADLFSAPKGLAVSADKGGGAQQMIYVLNADGTLVAGRYNRVDEFVGWFPWSGQGVVEYITSDQGDVMAEVAYDAVRVIEEQAAQAFFPMDCAVAATDTATLATLTGKSVSLYLNGYRGEFVVAVDGSLTGWTGGSLAGGFVGFSFESLASPYVGNVAGSAESAGQRLSARSISKVGATLNSVQAELEFCGRTYAAYRPGDNEEIVPPARDLDLRARVLGRSHEPEIPLRRRKPGRAKVLEFVTEVTI